MKNIFFRRCFAFFVLILAIPTQFIAQTGYPSVRKKHEKQVLENLYDHSRYSAASGNLTSPPYTYSTREISTVQVNLNAQGLNILGDAANEPSIAFNPKNPGNMVIGWRQFDTIGSNFRQAGYAYTFTGGETWTFPGVIDPGVLRSDPVLDCDGEGNFYFSSLALSTSGLWCDVFKSFDGGVTWDTGTYAYGGDKQWMSVDITSGNCYINWSSVGPCSPDIFTRSTNQGISYEGCSSIPGEPYWGTSTINRQGELFVCGAQNEDFVVARSSDAQLPGQAVTWDYSSTLNLDGSIVAFAGNANPNPAGLLGQATIAVDTGSSPYSGTLYLVCSVERKSTADPCDLMFSRSRDGGLSWSSPLRINSDTNQDAWQWFGSISVAPNGRIDVTWLDTRENPGTLLSNLYYAWSVDGGDTWSENFSLSESFDPHIGWPVQMRMGDYFDMFSDNSGAYLAWAATFNGGQDVYFSVIKPEISGIENPSGKWSVSLFQNYPNPCKNSTIIPFFLPASQVVILELYSPSGVMIQPLLHQFLASGRHEITVNTSTLPGGIYFYRLRTKDLTLFKKLVTAN